LLGAEDRVITDAAFDNFDILKRHVDFVHVNAVLANERERADEFLRNVYRHI